MHDHRHQMIQRCRPWLLSIAVGVITLLHSYRATYAAGFSLGLDARDVMQEEVAPLRSFLDDAERLLPPRVKARIGRPVRVSFVRQAGRVVAPRCAADPPGAARPPAQELGRVAVAATASSAHRVSLHGGFKAIILGGPARAPTYACGHRSMYRLALATLVHEVFHIYDRQERLSARSVYQNLQRFAPQGILRRVLPRNELRLRSPDPYEFHDIGESFAVNAEFYLLDPQYKCRRPTTYDYLEQEFRYRPFPHFHCAVNTTLYTSGQTFQVDPDRVYQVHYLFASQGDGVASRFGHVMFRLVLCAPERQEVGEACLADVQDHLVVSFAANLQGDPFISVWKGLTGGYASQMFIKPFSDTLVEYTELEFRDLQSLPLRLSADEKRRFIHRVLELYWGYAGKYYFFTNNCTSESLSLIKSVLPSPHVQSISRIIPYRLKNDLIARGFADSHAQQDPAAAQRDGLYFPSMMRAYDRTFMALRPTLPGSAPRTLHAYLNRSSAALRRQWALRAEAPHSATELSQFFSLEGLILTKQFKELQRILLQFILKHQTNPKYQPVRQKLQALLLAYKSNLPWLWVKTGYGIPLSSELVRPPLDIEASLIPPLLKEAFKMLQSEFPGIYQEYSLSEGNRLLFLQGIIAARQTESFRGARSRAPSSGTAR